MSNPELSSNQLSPAESGNPHIENTPPAEVKPINQKIIRETAKEAEKQMANARETIDKAYGGTLLKGAQETVDSLDKALDNDLEQMRKRYPEAAKKIDDRNALKNRPWWKKIIGK